MIARSRKRPRVHSISLRTFGWLCAREAAYSLLAPSFTDAARPWLRLSLCRSTLAQVRWATRRALQANPYREN